MVKAMYSGVAGLKAHQSKMDVIGNNIANVNTWGYKSMDTSFKESIYSLVNSGSAGSTSNGGYGGTNPSVVGYGSMVSAITANFTSGNQVPTGKKLDLYIDGTAFFAVGPIYGEGDAKNPADIYLSRVGDFSIVNGYLVDSNGRYVYGCSVDKGGDIYEPEAKRTQTSSNVPLKLPSSDESVTASSGRYREYLQNQADANKMDVWEFKAGDPLVKGAVSTLPALEQWLTNNPDTKWPVDPSPVAPAGPFDKLTTTQLKDALAAYNATLGGVAGLQRFVVSPGNPPQVMTVERLNTDVATVKDIPLSKTVTTPPDANGVITTTTYVASDTPGMQKEIVTTITPAMPGEPWDGPQFEDGRLDFDSTTGSYTMSGNVSDLKPLKIPTTCTWYDNGVPQIEENVVFNSYTIQPDGMIWGVSTTGHNYLIGCVGLVNVSNPSGMMKADGPYYQLGDSAGAGNVIKPGGTAGKLTSGYLESANVDIATEFSSMITTQRGFQANSKIITVTDEMLQELVNMKR